MGKQLTARRGEPAGAIAAVERREARMNRVRIARARAKRYLAVDKGGAKVVRETLIKETFPDRSACKNGGLGRDGLPARLRGGGEQDRRAHTMGGEKRESGRQRDGAPLRGRSRMRKKRRLRQQAGKGRGGYNSARPAQIHLSKKAKKR
jgi:hypothetical protein